MKIGHLLYISLLSLTTLCSFAASSSHIVIQNLYFPKATKEKDVYNLRLRASEVLAKLGVPKGRVLVRMNDSDRPYVMWECDYASAQEREQATQIEKESMEFKKILDNMGTLVSDFKRYTWQVAE